jgi:hypothetical protein
MDRCGPAWDVKDQHIPENISNMPNNFDDLIMIVTP